MVGKNLARLGFVLVGLCVCGVPAAFADSDASSTPGPDAGTAPGWESSIAPWQTLSVDFDSAVHMGRILAVTFPGTTGLPLEGALFLMASDNGGLSRSLNNGDIWENVIGGRGFSNDLCGGYTEAEIPGCKSLPQATLYGGPPGALPGYVGKDSNVLDAAAGAWPESPPILSMLCGLGGNLCRAPDGTDTAATALVYQAAHNLYVSPDAGRQWYPLAVHCRLAEDPYLQAVAVDQGLPGHVVVSGFNGPGPGVSGCLLPDNNMYCARRSIAWTENVGPQVAATMVATLTPDDSKGALKLVEQAGGGSIDPDCGAHCSACEGCSQASCEPCVACSTCLAALQSSPKWRFASVNHLAPAACGVAIESECKVDTALVNQPCHGRKPNYVAPPPLVKATADPVGKDIEAWCPAYVAFDSSPNNPIEKQSCTCTATPDCVYPEISHLAIDPRNGFVYATTTKSGVLLSRDYGAHWEHANKEEAWKGVAKTTTAGTTYTGAWNAAGVENQPVYANGASAGVQLLTRQHQGAGVAIDLNAHPEWIEDMGAMSMSWHPCGGDTMYSGNDARGHARKRGRLVATLPITWRDDNGKRASSVFMAIDDDCGGGAKPLPGPLVFRDTSSLLPGSGAILGVDTMWTGDAMADLSAPPLKLPRQVPAPAAYVTDNATPTCTGACGGRPTCRVEYTAAAVAPSDDRILYAWGWAHQIDAPVETLYCEWSTGLWRSVDRGQSWHLAAGIWDPNMDGHIHGGGGLHVLDRVDLSIAPNNPNRVMVSAAANGGNAALALTYDPTAVPAAGRVPWDCTGCKNGQSCLGGPTCIVGCDPTVPISDFCAAYQSAPASSGGAGATPYTSPVTCTPRTDGLLSCGVGTNANFQSDFVAWSTAARCNHVPPWTPALGGEQVARVPLSAACEPCPSSDPPPPADQPARSCCITARIMNSLKDPDTATCEASPTSNGNPHFTDYHGHTLSRGAAGGHVNQTLVVPTSAPSGTPQQRIFVAMNDTHTGVLSTTNGLVATQAGLSATWMQGAPGVRTYKNDNGRTTGFKQYAAIALNENWTARPDIWAVASTTADPAEPDETLRLLRITNAGAPWNDLAPTTYVYPNLFGLSLDGAAVVCGPPSDLIRGRPRYDLLSTNNLLVFSGTNTGVVIVPNDPAPNGLLPYANSAADVTPGAVSALKTLAGGTGSLEDRKVALRIQFQDGSQTAKDPCLSDIAVAGDYLFATVAQRLSTAAGRCTDMTPGLYRATIPKGWHLAKGATDCGTKPWCWNGGAADPLFTRVADLPFADPHALATYATKPAQGTVTAQGQRLLVGDWAPPAGQPGCDGGMWRCDVAQDGAVSECERLLRFAAIQDIQVSTSSPGESVATLLVGGEGLTPTTPYLGVPQFSADAGSAQDANFPPIAATAPHATTGVYKLIVAKDGTDAGQGQSASTPLNCAVALGTDGNALPATQDCDSSTATYCSVVAAQRPGEATEGLLNAASSLYALSVSNEFNAGIMVSTAMGQGAYWLPPAIGSAIDSLLACSKPGVQCSVDPFLFGSGELWIKAADAVAGCPQPTLVPDWIQAEALSGAGQGLWQSIPIPGTLVRSGALGLEPIADRIALSTLTDAPGPTATLTATSTANTWTFDVAAPTEGLQPLSAAALARIAVGWTGPAAPSGSHFFLNDAPLTGFVDERSAQPRFIGATQHLRIGTNTLRLALPDQQSFTLGTPSVALALARLLPPLEGPAPSRTATHRVLFAHQGPVAHRHAAWLVVGMANDATPTTVSWNGAPAIALQDAPYAQAPSRADGPSLRRVALDANNLRYGHNDVVFHVAPCSGDSCPIDANISQVALVLEYADDTALCLASVERCNDNLDNDCNGQTDEQDLTRACDGTDEDTCPLGHPTCGSGATCVETAQAPRLPQNPSNLHVTLDAMDALVDGTWIHTTAVPSTFDLLGALSSGAPLFDGLLLLGLQQEQGHLQSLVLHVRAATTTWNGSEVPVLLPAAPTTGNADPILTLTPESPVFIEGGTPLRLRIASSTTGGAEALGAFYGCPGGEISFAGHIAVTTHAALPCAVGLMPPTPDCAAIGSCAAWSDHTTSTAAALSLAIAWADVRYSDGGIEHWCMGESFFDFEAALRSGLDFGSHAWAPQQPRTITGMSVHLYTDATGTAAAVLVDGNSTRDVRACADEHGDGRTLELVLMPPVTMNFGSLRLYPAGPVGSPALPAGSLSDCAQANGAPITVLGSIPVRGVFDGMSNPGNGGCQGPNCGNGNGGCQGPNCGNGNGGCQGPNCGNGNGGCQGPNCGNGNGGCQGPNCGNGNGGCQGPNCGPGSGNGNGNGPAPTFPACQKPQMPGLATCADLLAGSVSPAAPISPAATALPLDLAWLEVRFVDGGSVPLCAPYDAVDLMNQLQQGLYLPYVADWVSPLTPPPGAPPVTEVDQLLLHLTHWPQLAPGGKSAAFCADAQGGDGLTIALQFPPQTAPVLRGEALLLAAAPLFSEATASGADLLVLSPQVPVVDLCAAPGVPCQIPVLCPTDPTPTQLPTPSLGVNALSLDLVFEAGANAPLVVPVSLGSGMTFDVVAALLTQSLHFGLPPEFQSYLQLAGGGLHLQRMVLHIGGPARTAQGLAVTPVTLAMEVTDTLTLEITDGTDLTAAHHHLVLVPDPSAAPVDSAYACGGDIAIPAVLHVRNACDVGGSNVCGEEVGGSLGQRCDSADPDGCPAGFLLPAAATLTCVADDAGEDHPIPVLWVEIAAIDFVYTCGAPVAGQAPGQAVELFAALVSGIDLQPPAPAASCAQGPNKLLGLHLTLATDLQGAPLSWTVGQSAPQPVRAQASPGSDGSFIDLVLAGDGAVVGSSVTLVRDPQVTGWQTAWWCPDSALVTVSDRIAVVVAP